MPAKTPYNPVQRSTPRVKGWILFTLFVWLALSLPNIALSVSEPLGLWGTAANLLLPCGVYLLLLVLTSRIGRATLWCVPLMVFAAFQMVLMLIFGRSPIATDMFLNVVTTNPSEAGELLAGLGGGFVVVVTIYLAVIVGAIVALLRKVRLPGPMMRRTRLCSLAMIAFGGVSLLCAVLMEKGYRPSDGLYPVNIGRNIIRAVEVTDATRHYAETSRDFSFGLSPVPADSVGDLYILVVGETSRAANWQMMGYDRPTNPRLSRRGNLVAFPHTFSESNTTHKSVPLLLSHLTAESYDSLRYVKSIITAFREAGYHTSVISAQKPNRSYIQFFCAEADTTIYLPLLEGVPSVSDVELLPFIKERMARRAPREMILVHSYGSHFDYRDRYPSSMAYFTPDAPYKAKKHDRPRLINAYDNAIRLTDLLLDSIASMAEATGARAAMVYTADHGEDIFDDGRDMFLHASPVPTCYQVHVPMLLWFSGKYVESRPEAASTAMAHSGGLVSSSSTFFHTALDLAGLHPAVFSPSRSLISPMWRPRNPRYVTDANEAVSLRSILHRYGEPLPPELQGHPGAPRRDVP